VNHLPMQPSWRCTACDATWPCPAARAQLRAEFADETVSLAMYLGRCMIDAAADRPDLAPGDLHRRFLAWIRTGRST
jgi:hypothetical protein